MKPEHSLIRWFDNRHISDEEVAEIVTTFRSTAVRIDLRLDNGAEKTTALRKLIEAKDAACRAVIEGRES